MAQERVFNLDALSDSYVLDFILHDKYTYEKVMEKRKAPAKLAVKEILDFLTEK